MENNKNIRIKDIAKMAGVSVGTVDRVIHQRGKVSEDAKLKVEKILDQTGYKPNLLARTLGSNKKVRIAALIPDPKQDEYWELSRKGIEQAVQEWEQYNVEVIPAYFDLYNSDKFEEVAETILQEELHGLIIAPIFYRESQNLFSKLREANIPFVLFNTNISETSSMCFIGQNLYQSGRVAGELLDMGLSDKKSIAVLHVDEDLENSVHLKEKEDGLRDYFNQKPNNKFEILSLNANTANGKSFEEAFVEILHSNDLHGILVTTSKGTHIAAAILEKHNASNIRLVGYDLLAENMKYLKAGTVDFLINQNPKRQAMLGISYVANHLLFQKEPPKDELFPLEIITRQNLDSYVSSKIH